MSKLREIDENALNETIVVEESRLSFLDSLILAYSKVLSHPISLLLFVVSSFEFLYIILNIDHSIFHYLSEELTTIHDASHTPPSVKMVIVFANRIAQFLSTYRCAFTPLYGAFIPFVSKSREPLACFIFAFVMYVMISFTYTQKFMITQVWLIYSFIRSKYYRTLIVFICVAVWYLQLHQLDIQTATKTGTGVTTATTPVQPVCPVNF